MKQVGGFAVIPAEVLAIGNGYAIAVYAALASHANRECVAWPSLDRLAGMTGWSRPTIVKAIKMLEAAQVIRKTRRETNGVHISNQYYLVHHGKTANVQVETSFTPLETTFTPVGNDIANDGNEIAPRSKRRLQEQEPKNKTNELNKPAVKGDTPPHRLVNRFYELIGGVSPSPGKDIAHGKALHSAGVTPNDLPELIEWVKKDWTGKDGFDLSTLARGVTRWNTSKQKPKPIHRLVV